MNQHGQGPLLFERFSLQLAVDVQVAVADLHLFARQAGHTFDTDHAGVVGMAKGDHFPPLRITPVKGFPIDQHAFARQFGRLDPVGGRRSAVRTDRNGRPRGLIRAIGKPVPAVGTDDRRGGLPGA